MRSRQLHSSLHDFAEQAGVALAGAAAAGSEVGYEILEEGGRRGHGPALYCYRALIGDFVDLHHGELAQLPAYLPALHAVASLDGLPAYLDAQGVPRPDGGPRELADAALRRFATRVFDEAGQDFALRPERFAPAYRELEQAAIRGRAQTVVVALIRGIGCASEEVPLSDGVVLAAPDHLEELPPDPSWLRGDVPSLVAAIAPGEGSGGMAEAFGRLRDLQTALRLFAPGIGCEPLVWVRGEGTPWRPLPLPGAAPGTGSVMVGASQEDELRAFCSLIARRRPPAGELAWALERFELGCDRVDPLSALTDHLLALRVLLEPEGPRSGRLAGRLAAICAVDGDRPHLAERVAHAISLEQAVVAGVVPDAHGGEALTAEVEHHLRSLLRDVICGHLEMPLDALADEILLGSPPAVTADLTTPVASADLGGYDEDYDDLEAWGEGAPTTAGALLGGR